MNKKKLIVLIVWCILVVGCFAAARSYLSAVLLMGTAVVLLFCIVSVKKSSHTLQMKLTMPEQIRQGRKKSGKLILTDNGAFPLFCVKGTVCCAYEAADAGAENADTKTANVMVSEETADASGNTDEETDTEQQTFSCAVKSYQKEEIIVKIRSTHAGIVHVWLRDLKVYDMFGLFSFSADVSKITADVIVVPAETGQTEANEAAAEAGQTAQTKPDEASAEAGQTAQAEANEASAEVKQDGQAEANEADAVTGQVAQDNADEKAQNVQIKENADAASKNVKSKKGAAKNAQHKKGAAKKKQRRGS